MKADEQVEQLINEYLDQGNYYKPINAAYLHPSVLALHDDIKPWLMERCGGPKAFWELMLAAAAIWFPERNKSKLGNIFCLRLEGEANIWWQGRPEFEAILRRYAKWRGLRP